MHARVVIMVGALGTYFALSLNPPAAKSVPLPVAMAVVVAVSAGAAAVVAVGMAVDVGPHRPYSALSLNPPVPLPAAMAMVVAVASVAVGMGSIGEVITPLSSSPHHVPHGVLQRSEWSHESWKQVSTTRPLLLSLPLHIHCVILRCFECSQHTHPSTMCLPHVPPLPPLLSSPTFSWVCFHFFVICVHARVRAW